MKRCLIFIIGILALSALYAQDRNINRAKKLIEQEKYTDAAILIRPLAEEGNAEAQYLAAKLFFDGKGVIKSETQGVKYATMAGEKGNYAAIELLCSHYKEKADYTNMYNALTKFCSQYPELLNDKIGLWLSMCYVYGYGCIKDEQKGYEMIKKSPYAQYYISGDGAADYWLYYMRKGGFNSLEEYAEALFQTPDTAEHGLNLVRFIINSKYQTTKAAYNEYLRQAQEENNPFAMACVAHLALQTDLENKFFISKMWAKRAAEANSNFGKYFWEHTAKDYHYVGEKYTEGAIFWVDYTGRNALIAQYPKKATYSNSDDIAKECNDGGLPWRLPTRNECYRIINNTQFTPVGEYWFCKYGCIHAETKSHTNAFKRNIYDYKGGVSVIADITPGLARYPRKGHASRIDMHIDRVIVENELTHIFIAYENRTKSNVSAYSFSPNTYLKSGQYKHKLIKQTNIGSSTLYPNDCTIIQLTFKGISPHWETFDLLEYKREIPNLTFIGMSDNGEYKNRIKSQVKSNPTPPAKEEEVYITAEQMPAFPDGINGVMTYLGKNLKLPADLKRDGVDNKIIISFVVEKDGSLNNFELLKGNNEALAQEAIRVLSSMPKCEPAKQGGKPVRMKYTLPINIK